MKPQPAAETSHTVMTTQAPQPWLGSAVGVIRDLTRELGLVCHDLRKAAGLDVEHDLNYFTRRDPRTIRNFESGAAKTRLADALVEGYAEAFGIESSAIAQMAMDRIRRDPGQPAEDAAQVLDRLVREAQKTPRTPAKKRRAKRSREEAE